MYRKRLPSLLNCLVIFGRYPIPGKVKTRLVSSLGPVRSAYLQKCLTENLIKEARAISNITDIVFFYNGGNKYLFEKWLGKDIIFVPQKGVNLGDKMKDAISRAKNMGYKKVVLIGTDVPHVKSIYIKEAFCRLDHYDVVIGPSDDGGYWLLGMREIFDIFDGIDWGTEKVLYQTLERLRNKKITYSLLKELIDIDTPEDIKKTGIHHIPPYISVIIPTLNEAGNIKNAIENAKSQDVEIIVVDGGSTDNTEKIAINCGVKIIKTCRGRAFQQNAGAEVAKGIILLFLHADTILPSNYSFDVFNISVDPSFIMGAFLFKTDMNHPFMKLIELIANIRARLLRLPYGDQVLFVKRDFFKKIGGFPETSFAEDLYFMHRISKMGKIQLIPKYAITSSRKWKNYGIIKTTYLHWYILLSFALDRIKKEVLL